MNLYMCICAIVKHCCTKFQTNGQHIYLYGRRSSINSSIFTFILLRFGASQAHSVDPQKLHVSGIS